MAVGTIYWVVRAFLAHVKFIVKEHSAIIKEHSMTINNHLAHETEAKEKQAVAFNNFSKTMERIEKKL